MPVETELYDILEIPPTASESDIKRAYRKKAVIHHPDKGGDENVFKKINSAYEILSDPKKKEMYDKYGKNGLKNSGTVPDDILTTMFGNMFSRMGGFNNIFNTYTNVRNAIVKTQPVIYNYEVSLRDICTCKTVKLRFNRERICSCAKNTQPKSCVSCSGKGMKVHVRQIGPGMVQQIQTPCSDCKGKGNIYSSCDNCKSGIQEQPKIFQLHLSPEMNHGYKYTFKDEGNEQHGYEPGDFIIIINYKPDSFFKLNNRDLCCKLSITLKEALCGFSKQVTHPDENIVNIEENRVITPETKTVIQNRGLDSNSNMIVSYDIKFPDKLTKEQTEILSEILEQ